MSKGFYRGDIPYSCKPLLDLIPNHENRVRLDGFQPSRAVKIRVGEVSAILTFAEFQELAAVCAAWVVANG